MRVSDCSAARSDLAPLDSDLARLRADFWDLQFDVNVHAPYLLSKAALPDMVAQKWGRIIAVGSIAGKLPTPFGVGYR